MEVFQEAVTSFLQLLGINGLFVLGLVSLLYTTRAHREARVAREMMQQVVKAG